MHSFWIWLVVCLMPTVSAMVQPVVGPTTTPSNPLYYGSLVGSDARVHLLNKRWRVVPEEYCAGRAYEWELLARPSTKPGSPFILRLFLPSGAMISHDVRCPLFLSNYICLDSPAVGKNRKHFLDTRTPPLGTCHANTIYLLSQTTCIMQNSWFRNDFEETQSPYFLTTEVPLLRSVIVGGLD